MTLVDVHAVAARYPDHDCSMLFSTSSRRPLCEVPSCPVVIKTIERVEVRPVFAEFEFDL